MIKRTALILMMVICIIAIPGASTYAQQQNRAGLAVFFGDGSVEKFCISFETESISGFDLLERSGLDIQANYSPLGAAVCKIDDLGCPADDTCLKCQEPLFWSYWQLVEDQWVYSTQGAGISQVRDGDVNAWVWGAGAAPGTATFDEICSQSPTPTHTSEATFTPLPTLSPIPTNTPLPSSTPQPSFTPIYTDPASSIPSSTATLIPSHTASPVQKDSDTLELDPTDDSTSADPFQEFSEEVTITPIIVRSIPTEEHLTSPSKVDLPPKKAVLDESGIQVLQQPTPTPAAANDSVIRSVLSEILKSVQSLVNGLLP